MIRTYEDLAVTRKQLQRAENALVSLHEEVFAKNPRNYALFAESYIDMILQLRAEIDAFLGIGAPPPPESMPETNGAVGEAHCVPESERVTAP